jgi:hypothetical protein
MPNQFPSYIVIERFLASVAAGNLTQQYTSPIDCDIVGISASVGTAPGGTSTVTVNGSVSPTSQLSKVSPFTLWSAANVPTILGTSKTSQTATLVTQGPVFQAYAQNYPFPGPGGTSGLVTAQSSVPTVENPVLSPPMQFQPSVTALVAPDLNYTDLDGYSRPTARLRNGDILTFVIGGTLGSAANLDISLLLLKH